nr:glycoside hydrolase family 19 protein [Pseudomonas luteola]
MLITEQQLLKIFPQARQVAGFFVPALNEAMARYQIITQKRVAAFLAQVGHESAQLTRLVENLNYSAEGLANTWPNRYAIAAAARPLAPNELAYKLARKPEAIANNVYANRMGNGSEASGDGWRYRGRGLIQITGRNNYASVGAALGLDLINHPELLERPEHAAMSAAQFWSVNGLNALADAGRFADITRRINGGMNGQAERIALRDKASEVLV